jgi:signal transduction histidine kinase/ABC-type nitrate/sulfonate/bicarbonate transport system substrate-binding protein
MAKIFLALIVLFINIVANDKLEKVSLQLKWKYQYQFAGFITAYEKGFYKDVGLDVELKELDKQIDIVDEVLKGKSTFAISDSALIYDKLRGKEIKALMAIFQESPFTLMGLNRDDLKSLTDLNGKTIAIHKGVDGISIKAMLKVKDISYNVHPPVFNFEKLLNKDIDLKVSYISNEPFVAKSKGLDVVSFSPKDFGFEGYGDILFTSNDILKNNPEMVKKFYLATYKGWMYAFKNIDEVIDLIYIKYNSLKKTKEALKYEANILKKLSGYGENFGELNIDKIKGIAQQFNLVKNEHNSLENLDHFIYEEPKQNIKVCYSKDTKPYVFINNTEPDGLGIDMLKLIEKYSNFNFEFIGPFTNRDDMKNLKLGKCEVIPITVTNKKVFDFLDHSKAYGKEYAALVTKIDVPYIHSLKELKGKKIGISELHKIGAKTLTEIFVDVEFIFMKPQEGFEKVKSGEIYAYIDGLMYLSYEIKQKHFNSLKISNIVNEITFDIGFGINSKKQTLIKELNSVIDNIPKIEFDDVLQKWRHLEIKKETDHTLLFQIIILSFIVFFFMLVVYIREKKLKNKIQEFNNTLEDKVKEETEKNRQKEEMMLHQSRLAQMGEMLSMIAHQWRQPLNNLSVLNQTVILKYRLGKLDDLVIDDFKENSKKQIQQMSQTIDDFSDFFKPDKEKTKFYIDDAINDTIDILNPIFKKKKILITTHFDGKYQLHSYKNEFGQALLNILNNANDAFKDKSIEDKKIDIFLSKKDKNVILKIIDNAGGIPNGIISRVFEPYFSTKDEKNGTGLGLYMTKIIIEEHIDGILSVSNTQNGAQFTIVFNGN